MTYVTILIMIFLSTSVLAGEKENLSGKSPQEIMEYYALSGELSAMSGGNAYIQSMNAAHDAHHIRLNSPNSGYIFQSNAAHDLHHRQMRGLSPNDRPLNPPGETVYACDSAEIKEGTVCHSVGTLSR